MTLSTTPNLLRLPVLTALVSLTGGKPGVDVRSRDVIDAALELFGPVADEKKARADASFIATHVMRQQGLLTPDSPRGFWGLTPEGVAVATGSPLVPSPPGPPANTPVAAPEPALARPEPHQEEQVDTVGVAIYTHMVEDSYNPDPYIRSLAISQTPCFGHYDQADSTCQSCGVVASCRSKQILRLAAIAAALRKRDAEMAALPTALPGGKSVAHIADETIEEVLASLEGGSTPPPPSRRGPAPTPTLGQENGTEMDAAVDTKCYVCKGVIPEKSRIVWVPTLGMRHKTCP